MVQLKDVVRLPGIFPDGSQHGVEGAEFEFCGVFRV